MIRITTGVDIARLPQEVFAYLADFENNPVWQSGMVECRWTSEGPLAVGSTYAQVATFLGRRIESAFEVIEYVPGQRVKATTTEGSFPITFTRLVEPRGEGTRVKAVIEGEASGFFRVAEPLLKPMVQRSVDRDYRRLKEVLEAPG